MSKLPRSVLAAALFAILPMAAPSFAQDPPAAGAASQNMRAFGAGNPFALGDLPRGRLRRHIERLPPAAQQRALDWLHSFDFTGGDLPYLRVDAAGGIFYEDPIFEGGEPEDAGGEITPPQAITEAEAFTLHSKPGAARTVYLDMDGHVVTGTIWNSGRADPLYMRPYDTNGDEGVFTASELNDIAETWKRLAEDFVPFNVDVTTEEPPSFGPSVGHILVTRKADQFNNPIYTCNCGGVAYLGVWGRSNFTYYQPALVFVANNSHYISEAAAHELGHNLGLSHDGTSSLDYYQGHGSGNNTDWAPIMGTAFNAQVSQWSKGEYQGANNGQDDLAIIQGYLGYRLDDHEDVAFASATPLTVTGDTSVVATNPVSDPANLNAANKGIIEDRSDVALFSVDVGDGTIDLTITPAWVATYASASRRGMNLDVEARLFDDTGFQVAQSDPTNDTFARITVDVAAGRYILEIAGAGAGNPLNTGYTDYGSLGQYFINGTVPAEVVPKVLTGLTIAGPSSVNEVSSASYSATASWDDGTTSAVAASWGENSAFASIDASGLLTTFTVISDQSVTVGASYSSGGVSKTAAKTVAIVDSVKILTGLTISGPSSVNEVSAASYSATASWDDGTTSTVAASWSENSAFASIDASGLLTTSTVIGDQSVTVGASHSSGGVTKTADTTVTIVDSVKILTGLTISGPFSVIETSSAGYSATASWDDGTTSMVAASWSENSAFASIDDSGALTTFTVTRNQSVTVNASHTSDGVTKTANLTVTIINSVIGDFDGDEDADIFWRYLGDGRNKLWTMDGLTREAVAKVPKFANTNLAVAGLGDFTGDGKTDVLWRNGVTGANKLWEMDGATRVSNKNLPSFTNTDWVVAGVADFTGDSKADIFWHNAKTAANKIWEMDGATRVAQGKIPKFASTKWQPVGVGDFNGNGKADILWRHMVTGANKIWPMNGFNRVANASIPTLKSANWVVAGLGDFDKDGKTDILWRNGVTGANKIWLMNGKTVKAQSNIPRLANTDWAVVGIGDYDANEEADILWRNGTSGANKVWLMEGFTRADQSHIPKYGDTQWQVQQ